MARRQTLRNELDRLSKCSASERDAVFDQIDSIVEECETATRHAATQRREDYDLNLYLKFVKRRAKEFDATIRAGEYLTDDRVKAIAFPEDFSQLYERLKLLVKLHS